MSVLNDLIAQIEDVTLRERIGKEVERLTKQKKFGLVFEEHLPECTALYDIPVKIGALVAVKTGKINDVYRRIFYIKGEDDRIIIEMKNLLEQYIEINKGFDKVRIQFDFNPMNTF